MSVALREKIYNAILAECDILAVSPSGASGDEIARRLAQMVYQEIAARIDQDIERLTRERDQARKERCGSLCPRAAESVAAMQQRNEHFTKHLLAALGLTERELGQTGPRYTDPMVKVLDTIHQLRQGVLSAALPGIERDFTWAVEQLDQGKSIQHPILEGGVISLYGKTTAGVPIYRINVSSLLWTEEKGGPKFARIEAQAKLTYGWESFEPGHQP